MDDSARILIVDDNPHLRQAATRVMEMAGHRAVQAASGDEALRLARESAPDLILLDINMPEMTGYEVCERLKADGRLKEIPIIFVSALTETLDKVKAFTVGGVDYLTKPFHFEEMQARVATHLKLRQLQIELERHNRHLQDLVRAQVKEISDSQMATIFALAKLAESRDQETGRHLERVQVFCRLLAAQLGQQPRYAASITPAYLDNILHASPLHDIGKVGIPDAILLKPGKLTPEEGRLMRQHPTIGAQTLEAVREHYPRNAFINMGIAIARSHHEHWDGSGYPDGLTGEDIPLSARIIAVADSYDSLRSVRVYKEAMPHDKSRESILKSSGARFDPTVVEAFRQLDEQFAQTCAELHD